MSPGLQLVLFALAQLGIATGCGVDAHRYGQGKLVTAATVLSLALVGPAVLILAVSMATWPLERWYLWLWPLSAPGLLSYLVLRPVLVAVDRLEEAMYALEPRRRKRE